jgi:hypothetical protein
MVVDGSNQIVILTGNAGVIAVFPRAAWRNRNCEAVGVKKNRIEAIIPDLHYERGLPFKAILAKGLFLIGIYARSAN